MKNIASACGIDCLNCECYLATRNNDRAEKEVIARKWSKQYETDLTPDDIECNGCMSDGIHFAWCNECPIRKCVSDRDYESCAECGDFPCKTLNFLYDGVPEAKINIENMRLK